MSSESARPDPSSPGQLSAPAFLVSSRGGPHERWYALSERLVIGRDDGRPDATPGWVLVADPTVSRSHCVITRGADGRCFVRDTSRNGTRVDGRRLVPNVEVELYPGQTISVGDRQDFVVVFQQSTEAIPVPEGATLATPSRSVVTVLVGDIRDYTVLVRRSPSPEVQQSVSRVFQILTDHVTAEGGTVKEFQGDALVAFWEGNFSGKQAAAACRAALRLDEVARSLAADEAVWRVPDFSLKMDWALASGQVLIDSFGGQRPVGLSMIGEAPVLAFRLEKFASDQTARILACPATRAMAGAAFRFRDLGLIQAKGFERPEHVFALEAAVAGAETPIVSPEAL